MYTSSLTLYDGMGSVKYKEGKARLFIQYLTLSYFLSIRRDPALTWIFIHGPDLRQEIYRGVGDSVTIDYYDARRLRAVPSTILMFSKRH